MKKPSNFEERKREPGKLDMLCEAKFLIIGRFGMMIATNLLKNSDQIVAHSVSQFVILLLLCETVNQSIRGYSLSSPVSDLVSGEAWNWPVDWATKTTNISVSVLSPNVQDVLAWRNLHGNFLSFSVSNVWDSIRPRSMEVPWFRVVWFAHCIPKHAFLMWLIMKRKLKTQDVLRHWDINANATTSLLCPLCGLQPGSHDHLFFECSYAEQVWKRVCISADIDFCSAIWDVIIAKFVSISRSARADYIIAKVVLAATAYYVWQERNARLFSNNKKMTTVQLSETIKATVRLKILSLRFKKKERTEYIAKLWNLPKLCLIEKN